MRYHSPLPTDAPRVLLLSGIGTRINPYLSLLQGGLEAAGASVRLTGILSGEDLLPNRGGPHIIHLHWLERYLLPPPYRPAKESLLFQSGASRLIRRVLNNGFGYQVRRWWGLRRLFAQLAMFQRAGGCVAYTVHNLDAHETVGWAERWGAHKLLRVADVLHVHDISTADAIARRTGRHEGVVVVPHGHYLTAYENTISREAARRRLNLPQDVFIFLSLGLVRPYKGQEDLIPAFAGLPGNDKRLIVAGQPASPGYAETLQRLAGADERIRLDLTLVPATEIQCYLNAADICVLPYRQITTSGAALLAMSFGVAVLAPAIGAFPRLIEDQRGVLYDPVQAGALATALLSATEQDWHARREVIREWVAQFDWGGIGAQLLAAYAATQPARTKTG